MLNERGARGTDKQVQEQTNGKKESDRRKEQDERKKEETKEKGEREGGRRKYVPGKGWSQYLETRSFTLGL